jgi:regulator of protease activity HflC (stomatin/prohibitin superfamily)
MHVKTLRDEFQIPGVDKLLKVRLRTVALDILPPEVITRDNISIKVNAVIYWKSMKLEESWGRVRQIKEKALRKLNHSSGAERLRNFIEY